MEKITSHKDLIVWQKAIALACRVYAATRLLPSDEGFDLASELRRAVVAIPSSIAEGAARQGRADFIQYLHIARGSLAALETQFMIASRQESLSDTQAILRDIEDVGRLLTGLLRSLAASSRAAHAKACANQPPAARL